MRILASDSFQKGLTEQPTPLKAKHPNALHRLACLAGVQIMLQCICQAITMLIVTY